MAKKLTKIPQIPDEILNAIDDKKLILFVGAGLSKLFGYPLWNEMANNLIKECLNHDVITRSDASVLSTSGFNSMQIVTITYERLKRIGVDEAQKIIKCQLKMNEKIDKDKINQVSEYLSHYQCQILTTNADLSLDKSTSFLETNIVDNFKEWDKVVDFNSIFHLHGSINDFDSMVFTSNQYAESYMTGSNFSNNLLKFFNDEYTFLFIGYGANEFELIRYFLNAKNKSRRNIYMLNGYLKNEKIKRKFDKEYFKSIGITLLPFSREEKGYDALIDVLKCWDDSVVTKTLAHTHVGDDLKKAFSKPPIKNSIKYVKANENNNEFIKAFLNSPYLNDWFIELKDEELFSIDNIKPCVKHKDNTVSSRNWNGLAIIVAYLNQKHENDEIDEFVIKLINKSIDKYINDPEKDKAKRLDSSYVILDKISQIIFSKLKYINECDIVNFIKVYLNSPYSFPYSLILDFSQNYFAGLDKEKLFNILKTIIESKKGNDVYDLLTNENVQKYIKDISYEIYKYSKRRLYCTNNHFFNMGAFYDYPDKPIYGDNTDAILINWLKISSKCIDVGLLKRDIKKCIHSSKMHLKRCGLALININFDKLSETFFKNIDLFFNDIDYYSDLCLLIYDNYRNLSEEEKENIKNKIYNSAWDRNRDILQNHLFNIIKKYDSTVIAKEESKKELNIALNINKAIYEIDTNIDEDAEVLYSKIKDLTIKDSLKYYDEQKSNSYYFREVLDLALLKYIDNNGINLDYNCLDTFDSEFLCYLLEKKENDVEILKNISKIFKERNYTDGYSSMLYCCEKLRQSNNYEDMNEILMCINIDNILFSKSVNTEDIISQCINEKMFNYLELCIYTACKDTKRIRYLKELINKLKKSNNQLFKASLAYNIGIIYNCINKRYAIQMIDYIFDNKYKYTNPSYLMYAMSNDETDEIINNLLNRDDFIKFVTSKNNKNENHDIKIRYGNIIIKRYLNENYDKSTVVERYLKRCGFYSLSRNIEYICAIYKNNKTNIDKLNNMLLIESYEIKNLKSSPNYQADLLIKSLSRLVVVVDNKLPVIWILIIELFDCFNHNFSNETLTLIERYKDEESENIIKLVDKYVDTYQNDLLNEKGIKKVISILQKNTKYSEALKIWKNKLTRVNSDFFNN